MTKTKYTAYYDHNTRAYGRMVAYDGGAFVRKLQFTSLEALERDVSEIASHERNNGGMSLVNYLQLPLARKSFDRLKQTCEAALNGHLEERVAVA